MDGYSKFFPFAFVAINNVHQDAYGIYEIFRQNVCLYVGMAKDQTIRERLTQHYNRCENDFLKLWIKSSYNLRFRYFIASEYDSIAKIEDQKIRYLGPICNKDRRLKNV